MRPNSVLAALFLLSAVNAYAEDAVFVPKNTIDHKEMPRRAHFGLDTGFISLKNDNADITGVVFKLEGKYGFSSKWAASLFGSQSFDTSALTSIFTSIGVSSTYALLGSQLRDRATIAMNDTEVSSQTEWIKPALLVGLNVKQVFFNGSTRAVPLSGIGGQISYFFGSNATWGFRLGAGIDLLSNGTESITPIQILGGINYWL